MENERLRLLAAQEEMEKQRKVEEKRIEEEQKERQQQQLMAEQALVEFEEKRKQTINYNEKQEKTLQILKSIFKWKKRLIR